MMFSNILQTLKINFLNMDKEQIINKLCLSIEKITNKNLYWIDKVQKMKDLKVKKPEDDELIIELENEITYNKNRIQKLETELNDALKNDKSIDMEKEEKKNKGIGAGGANTNVHGKKFEEKTNIENYLIENGFEKTIFSKNKYDYILSKTFDNKKVIYLCQNGLKTYMKKEYNIDVFRCPDEAYIIQYSDGKKIIKILEKKEQNVDGSVETKLWACPSLKREYELVLNLPNSNENFVIDYALCINDYLYKLLASDKPKYLILVKILNENGINFYNGDCQNYFPSVFQWLLN